MMKRKNQNKYGACVATLIFMFLNIYQIFSSNHATETYVNNQSLYCIKLMFD